MNKRILIVIMIFLTSFNIIFSSDNFFTCSFTNSCPNGINLFFANNHFKDSDGNILSSNIAIHKTTNYDFGLCCKFNNIIPISSLNTEFEDFSNINNKCSNGGNDIFYTTSNNRNSRIAVLKLNSINNTVAKNIFKKRFCINLNDPHYSLDVFVSDKPEAKNIGYNCLFKLSNYTNGVVSSCDAKYNGGKEYKYTVYGKIWKDTNSLKCNNDCTSKLDHRVYSACSQKVEACRFVPKECDGSLYNSWVKYDSNHDGKINSSDSGEIQCSAPWNNIRGNVFTNIKLKIKADKNKCSNLIKKKYSVILNNELVTMDVYICKN